MTTWGFSTLLFSLFADLCIELFHICIKEARMEAFDYQSWLEWVLKEDVGDGDHTSLACVPTAERQEAVLLIKQKGTVAGVELARMFFAHEDAESEFELMIADGTQVTEGDHCFKVKSTAQTILRLERTVLNVMQRMSGIATLTSEVKASVAHTNCQILDTRKTTPGFRFFEKEAVRIGGGGNHRMGLFDMIMIKDNHVDYSGGIKPALDRVKTYLHEQGRALNIEIEVRDFDELDKVLKHGGADRVMLDNFTPEELREAIRIIGDQLETEASGGINPQNVVAYAEAGVDYVSMGALTHSAGIMDMSLKAV